MTFRESLDKHLQAIRNRDLQALAETLPKDRLVLVMADGRLVQDAAEFLGLHRGWFESPTWSLDFHEVSVFESFELAVALFHLDYRDTSSGTTRLHETSYLTLVFQKQGDRWVMVQDQNTPVKRPPA